MQHKELHLTRAYISLAKLSHNMHLLAGLAGNRPLYPAIKANAYGHGASRVAEHLISLGYKTLCTAHLSEAIELLEQGIQARYIVLSPTLPKNAEYFIQYNLIPVVCTLDQVSALHKAAAQANTTVPAHIKVDTGMGRVGIAPTEIVAFLEACRKYRRVNIDGIMSHFPTADSKHKEFSKQQIREFTDIIHSTKQFSIPCFHFANSAAIFDLPEAGLDAVRPGISIYGLKPSAEIVNPQVKNLQPILSLRTSITYLKTVPAGKGISYGHTFITKKETLVATVPAGYGDGLMRILSNNMDMLVRGQRCRQIGRICMDQSLLDVTPLKGKVKAGDEVTIMGSDGKESITADELAQKAATINYEITTGIAQRVPRIYL